MLAAALVSAAPALLDWSLPTPIAWLNPFDTPRLTDLTVSIVIFLAEHGDAIMTSIAETAAAAAIMGFVAWIAFVAGRSRQGPLLLACVLCAIVVLPVPSQALEIRREDNGNVLIAADETIADTLIAAGETVEVNGNIEGDLIAVGRRVVIRGRVGGVVLTVAQTVTIDGEVEGSVFGFGQTLNVSPARIGRNLFGVGESINAGQRMNIEENAVVFAQRASFAGPVGRDVLGFAEEIEVGSTVGGTLTAFADRVTLLAPARIAGDVNAHIPQEDHLTISPSAEVGGELTIDIRGGPERPNQYATGRFYLIQVLWFAAAFVTGVILLALLPSLRRASLRSVGNALVASGFGLVTLVAVPIIAVLVAVTIIGIPVAMLGLLLWLAGLYLAKVVLAHVIGARLVDMSGNPRHFAVALAIGLLLVMVAVNLPFIGGLLNFVLTICGLGLLVLFVWRTFRDEPPPGEAAV
jgi:cytoskeletal protein CcmA (bactofilin family)